MQRVKVHTISLGCPKNRVDTERMLSCFGNDLQAADTPEEADLVLINTCGFIGPAIEESIQTILDAAQDIEGINPKPLLAVTGCLVGRFEAELRKEMPEVDLWLPVRELDDWPRRVAQAMGRKFPEQDDAARVLSTGPSFAYLKVAEGCDHRCAFCTIPSIRGGHKSFDSDMLVEQSRRLLEQGVSELVMVAQDLTAYGREFDSNEGLIPLIEKLMPLPGLQWLRPMYLYPAGLTPELLQFIRDAGRPLLPYFDVPVQHAHPDILSHMGRPFARDPRKVIDRIREYVPDAALRTSIIVGFPGETDEHFKSLVQFVRQSRFMHLGVFGYCDEEGTAAHGMADKVEQHVIEERRKELMRIQAEISEDILLDFEGTTQDVLVDAQHPEWPGLHVGRCWFQAPEADGVTYVSGEGVTPGRMVQARIDEAKTYDLVGLV